MLGQYVREILNQEVFRQKKFIFFKISFEFLRLSPTFFRFSHLFQIIRLSRSIGNRSKDDFIVRVNLFPPSHFFKFGKKKYSSSSSSFSIFCTPFLDLCLPKTFPFFAVDYPSCQSTSYRFVNISYLPWLSSVSLAFS